MFRKKNNKRYKNRNKYFFFYRYTRGLSRASKIVTNEKNYVTRTTWRTRVTHNGVGGAYEGAAAVVIVSHACIYVLRMTRDRARRLRRHNTAEDET